MCRHRVNTVLLSNPEQLHAARSTVWNWKGSTGNLLDFSGTSGGGTGIVKFTMNATCCISITLMKMAKIVQNKAEALKKEMCDRLYSKFL